MVTLSAEFPNDNPALHRGVIWVCLEPVGPATADREAVPIPAPVIEAVRVVEDVAPPSEIIAVELEMALVTAEIDRPDDDEPIVVEEIEPLGDVETISVAPMTGASAIAEELAPMIEELLAEEAPTTISEAIAPTPSTALPPAPDDPFTILCCALADVAIAADAHHAAAALPALLLDGRIDETLPAEVLASLTEGGIADGSCVTEAFATITNAWRAVLSGTSDDLSACGAAMLDEWAADLLARLLGAPSRTPLLRRDLRSRGVAAFGLAA